MDIAAASAATEALQKATQNPVASLISVPAQNNTNFGQSPGYRTQDVLNIQPVIPIGIAKDWNLLVRWIGPIVYQPVPNVPGTPETGEYELGDMQPTFFISPKKRGKLIWGVGPSLLLPTATNTDLGYGKFGIVQSVVALTRPAHWTLGVLANNVWSVAGSGSRPDAKKFLLQHFINYNHPANTTGLDHAPTYRLSVPQVNEGAGEDDDGEKTETDRRAAIAEELNWLQHILTFPPKLRPALHTSHAIDGEDRLTSKGYVASTTSDFKSAGCEAYD